MRLKKTGPALLLVLMLMLAMTVAAGAEGEGAANRYNVMFVLDASVSMNETDARGLRFEALRLFNSLLADQGNTLGGVVFSTGVDRATGPEPVSGPEEKEALVKTLKNVSYPGGWTNIGRGLSEALSRLEEKGDAELPSVIILLSDGNTAMYSQQLTREAVRQRDGAVQQAQERGIPIYSVCLNCNGTADLSEMKNISADTEGVFMEVRDASDLNRVFQVFYELIYGTRSVTLTDDVFPQDGHLETPFEVPGFGVEEVNILIQGRAQEITLTKPDGSPEATDAVVYDSFTAIKLTELVPGEWKLLTEGVSGDRIKIEVIYNSNLSVTLYMNQEGDELDPVEPVSFTARLSAGEEEAASREDYAGFTAELTAFDENDEELWRLPMSLGATGFEADSRFEEGTYSFEATVSGHSLSRSSQRLGPVRFAAPARPAQTPAPTPVPTPKAADNTPPVADRRTVRATVPVWPVLGGKLSLDLGTAVHDPEGGELQYTVSETDFREGSEYRINPSGVLNVTLGNFRLRGGNLTVQASDPDGLSCEVTVTLRVINTVVILLGLLAVLLVVLMIRLLGNRTREAPFHATVTVTTEKDGEVRTGTPCTLSRKGKLSLAAIDGIDNIGLDYGRCHFEGASDSFVFLVTDRKVEWRGYQTVHVRIDSDTETSILVDGDPNRKMRILYESGNPVLDEFLQDFDVV